ncbi:hypothetical protein WHR41_00546 [Cladosporium halotolerans]|uniref:Bola-like protein n=1 Tax=Cladosporium halotolerans TaxID=1052096 RepID=A0AB34L0Q7_9PEZI
MSLTNAALTSLHCYQHIPHIMSAQTDTEATQNQLSSGITADSLAATLRSKLDAAHVDIQDLSGGCGQMFEAIIVSSQFEKKMTLARHRLVNSVLKEEIAAIHAWTPKCFTPAEWEKKKGTAA